MNDKSDCIDLPSIIAGKSVFGKDEGLVRKILDFDGKHELFRIHDVGYWDGILPAIKNASVNQNELENIPLRKIAEVIRKLPEFYFIDDENYKKISKVTGSPLSFVHEGIDFMKAWFSDINKYIAKCFNDNAHYLNTKPVVAVLPSNSEQETAFVFTQALLSRNSLIVRPSSLGASSFASYEYVRALLQAVDGMNDSSLEPLKRSISIVNHGDRDYLEKLCVDDWNYIFFGDDNSIKNIEKNIRMHCVPRKVLGYGTGLSMTIVEDYIEGVNAISGIAQSVVVNVGNECVSTDIIYVHKDISHKFKSKLAYELKKHVSCDPFSPESIGLVHPDNIDFIYGELFVRGKHNQLQKEYREGRLTIQPSIIELSSYDSAMEYPGPIVSVRDYQDIDELRALIRKDLKDNNMQRNLVTSIYTGSDKKFAEIAKITSTHLVKQNLPSHDFNTNLAHQGIYLLRELTRPLYIDRRR